VEGWTFVSLVGLGFLVWFVLVFLFTPRIDYHFTTPPCDEPHLIRVLGEGAYMALEQSRAVTEEQLESIVKLIVDLALGQAEKKEGKARG
jgi:hypothetical protein